MIFDRATQSNQMEYCDVRLNTNSQKGNFRACLHKQFVYSI